MVSTRKSIGDAASASALPIRRSRKSAAPAFLDDQDPLTLPTGPQSTEATAAATFTGVVIMPASSSNSFKLPYSKERTMPTEVASPDSYVNDDGTDYETPATSASATPAVSAAPSARDGRSSRKRKLDRFEDETMFGEEEYMMDEEIQGTAANAEMKRIMEEQASIMAEYGYPHHGKTTSAKKIPNAAAQQDLHDLDGANDVDTSTDAEMARVMQEQEYGLADSHSKKAPAKKLPKGAVQQGRVIVLDAESDSELSDPDFSDSSENLPLSKKQRTTKLGITPKKVAKKVTKKAPAVQKKQSGKKSASSALPKRQASMKARKAIAISDIINSDGEESVLSLPPSDDDMSELAHFDGDSLDEDDDDEDDIDPASSLPWQSVGNLADWRQNHEERKRMNRAARERKKLEKAHPEIKTMWGDLEKTPTIPTTQAAQPESITRQLKSFQLEGLNWMTKQEKTKWKGGLLGDEMGMGKTIQAVSLIMSDYPQKQPTLVAVPPVALMQWTNEIKEYTDGKLKVLVYHGTNSKAKNLSLKELKSYDVIMISYAGIESIYRKEVKGWKRGDKIVKEESAIHAIHFHRIILDEAHSIKSRTTGVAKACFALQATYKWCLSGTPVQNRIGEFFSLLRFLEVSPFANYFCKKCTCSALHWSQSVDYKCNHCGHRSLDHVSVFNQEILNPITTGQSEAVRKEAMRKLRLLTDHIMLRRMKRDHTSSMELPPKEVVIHREFFGEIERDFSSSIMTNTSRTFDTYVSRGVMLNNYANIFGLIMQMRQVSDHPDLLLRKHAEGGQNILVCNICDEMAEDAIRSKCKHEFCRSCAKDYVRSVEGTGGEADCPRCHIPLAIDWEQPEIEQDEDAVKKSSIINRIKMENWTSSTKIEMLVYDLYKLRSKKQTLKSIVFSQFTSMLQLVEWRLRRAGFNTVMLDGTMTPAQRQRSIEHFMNNTDVEVFLVSLKAGGVALNLVEASRVFIVDPWWNPAAEWQSADRCHRIGQRRPCVITRLCIEDSVESRIVMLQEKKAHMIQATVNKDDVAMEKLTPEDMQFLFRGS